MIDVFPTPGPMACPLFHNPYVIDTISWVEQGG